MEESKTTGVAKDPAELKAKGSAEEAAVAGPSVSPSKKDVQVVNRAMQYLAAGKRDLLIQDPASAVASLVQCCELLSEHYGETAVECGEAYYYYGRALLDLARVEAGVIDNVLDGVPEDDQSEDDSLVEDPEKCSEEEKEKVAEDVGKALEENFEELEKMKREKEEATKKVELGDGGEVEIAAAEVEEKGDLKKAVRTDKVELEGAKDAKVDQNGDSKNVKDVDEKSERERKVEENGDARMEVAEEKSVGKNGDVKEVNGKAAKSVEKGEPKDPTTDAKAEENGDSGNGRDSVKNVGRKAADESEENSAEDDDEEEEEGEEKGEESQEGGEDENGEEEDAKDESIASDTEANTEAKDTGDAAAVEKEEEEDPSNLQLAWEMLELAKTIFVKQAQAMKEETEKEKETKFNVESRVCDTLQILGELSIENENYEQSIVDLSACLERRRKLLPDDSRLIAQTFYQLGVAQGFGIRFDEAVESLLAAIAVLEKRVDNLKAEKESKDPAKKNDAFYTREGEIKELEGLIPEIREKIADTKDMKEETRKKLGDRRLMEEEISSTLSKFAGSSEANGEGSSKTVSTLQIRKRKKSGDDSKEASEAKKPHVENGDANGHASTSK